MAIPTCNLPTSNNVLKDKKNKLRQQRQERRDNPQRRNVSHELMGNNSSDNFSDDERKLDTSQQLNSTGEVGQNDLDVSVSVSNE